MTKKKYLVYLKYKKMKKLILIITLFASNFVQAQEKNFDEPEIAIFKLFADAEIKLKDSVAIYTLNFELHIKKLNGKTIVTNITANDSLAFTIFPMYTKLKTINFTRLMGAKNNIRLVIPILIYGNSYDKQQYKDTDGNALINFNAALNAAFALYNPTKYNNLKESKVELSNLLHKESKNKSALWNAVIMNPIWIDITRIKNSKTADNRGMVHTPN